MFLPYEFFSLTIKNNIKISLSIQGCIDGVLILRVHFYKLIKQLYVANLLIIT